MKYYLLNLGTKLLAKIEIILIPKSFLKYTLNQPQLCDT